jgi:hypothetical protein
MNFCLSTFHKPVYERYKCTRDYKNPYIIRVSEIRKFPEQVLRETAGKDQPSPEEKMKTALSDVHLGFVYHFSNYPEAFFACHKFFFVFHNIVYFYKLVIIDFKYITNIN